MKTTIVCGMLGSGKTTFISQFVKTLEGKSVVLVNDFGKAGIDGEIFSAGGIESIELPSGCVCCTLKFDLISSIQAIRQKFKPDNLVIEPSGIASPSGVVEVLDTLKIPEVTIIGIVDATEFLELNHEDRFGRFFQDQISHSDLVLVNKADLVEKELLLQTIGQVEQMNDGAIVLGGVQGVADHPLPQLVSGPKTADRNAGHLNFETHSFRLGSEIDHEAFSDFFGEMSTGKFGQILRAKALVNTLQGPYKFDLAFTNIRSIPFEKTVEGSRLVVIGTNIRKQEIAALFPSPFTFL